MPNLTISARRGGSEGSKKFRAWANALLSISKKGNGAYKTTHRSQPREKGVC